jgi:AcrR family transcriptional regulator
MGTKERRERERIDTRDRILAAAREMFAKEGVEGVTMRAIANRIEYTPTALYHHFPNKQALLTELCERDYESLARHFRDQPAPADPIARLYAIGEAYLRFAIEFPSQYRFMFMTVLPELKHADGYVEASRNDPERNAYVSLRNACADAIGAGLLRPEYADADQVAQIHWSTIHGLVSLPIVKHSQGFVPWKDLRKTARLAMETLVRGMTREHRT